MRGIDFKFKRRWRPGDHNPHHNLVIMIWGRPIELEHGGGSKDTISVFRDKDRLYALSVNHGLNYVGLDEYDLSAKSQLKKHEDRDSGEDYLALDSTGDVFIQQDQEIDEILGPKGVDQREATLVRKLIEYLPY